MQDPNALSLFHEILGKTRAGRISWEPTASESTFIAPLPGGLLAKVEPTVDWENGDRIESSALVLEGEEGELLRITSTIDGLGWDDLATLHELAKRRALGVDAKVKKLLGELAKM